MSDEPHPAIVQAAAAKNSLGVSAPETGLFDRDVESSTDA